MTTDLLIVIILGVVVIFLPIASVISQKRAQKLRFKCPKCGHVFKPLFMKFDLNFVVMAPLGYIMSFLIKQKYFLKCPECKKYSWCSIVEENDPQNRF